MVLEPRDLQQEQFLDEALSRATTDPISVSIRDLLALWGARRRGSEVVNRIERDLAAKSLTTYPRFDDGWIDSMVALVAETSKESSGPAEQSIAFAENGGPADAGGNDGAGIPDAMLRVGSLESATKGVRSVKREDNLSVAESRMMSSDYSQLAVLSGRDLHGAVSWESIAQSRMANPEASLREAIVQAEAVSRDADLMALIPRIVESGYVFVRDHDRTICGIVTTADLSNEFALLARPFLLVREVERRLRQVLNRKVPVEELSAIKDPNQDSRPVESAEQLTMGEYVRLLQLPGTRTRLGWSVDWKVFGEALEQVRSVRNEVMHFSPDPIEPERVDQVRHFIKWLRLLDP